ncbi:hypothetical protein GRI42_11700 [Erythrobacter gaetbuli]|uniref:Uncharacterized protein n=1 Tax=Qipengyuania gaetbuli TaxID=266952 RepID=A0A844Y3H5_9SPHN|nr:hypothetical protein [Qipengyuania gaetbuli]MXO51967.1 hypothetical protein [Qipengyuania gaetbuli]
MSKPLFALAATAAAFAVTPVAAQQPVDTGDERYNMVVVYGDDACPPSEGDTIIVCARKAEAERYRIPEALRTSSSPANESWASRVESLEMVGASGILSCSPAGAGGVLGCTEQFIDKAYAEKREGSDVRFSQIIAEQREERLSTIDADAERTQRDVEMIEREYMERLARERGEPLPGDEAAPATEPTVVAKEPEAADQPE